MTEENVKEVKQSALIKVEFEENEREETPKFLIAPDAYDAQIVSAEAVETKGWKTDELVQKIVFNLKILNQKEVIVLPLFCRALIKKCGGTYSNSKLYDVLDNANLIPATKNETEKNLRSLPELVEWLNANLNGRLCRASVQTVNKGQKDDEYSCVSGILRFEVVVPEVKSTQL